MAKKSKGNRVQVILECTEHKDSGMPGTSRIYKSCIIKRILSQWVCDNATCIYFCEQII